MIVECCKDLFKFHHLLWKYTGIGRPIKNWAVYYLWILLFNFAVTFYYPFHLIVGLFQLRAAEDIFKNLAINLADLGCSLKFLIVWMNYKQILVIENLLTHLDGRIQYKEERTYFKQIVTNCKYIYYTFGIIYGTAWVSLEFSMFFGNEKTLIYPGWLPIDWENSTVKYWIANTYQCIGMTIQIAINLAQDSYPSICLALLSGHVKLLGIRMSQLGTEPNKSQRINNSDLRVCIADHKRIIQLYGILNAVLSKWMFFQITVTGFNLCCTIIYLVFYARDIFGMIYYAAFLLAMPLQIFPSCYFGSDFEIELTNLPYALFSSNWICQNREFQQNMIIIGQRCFKVTSFQCLGLVKIHLNSFYTAIKSAYSLFAVMLQVK